MSCAHDRRGKESFFTVSACCKTISRKYIVFQACFRFVFFDHTALFFLGNECHGTSIFCGITTGFPETLHSLSGRSTTTMHHGVRPESFSRNHFPGYNNTRPRKRHPKGGVEKRREESPSSFPAAPPSSLTHSSLTEREKLDCLLPYTTTDYRGAHVNRQEGRKSPTSHLELNVCRLLLSSVSV